MKKIFSTLLIIQIVLIVSCDPNRVYDTNKNITDDIWNQDEIISFQPEIIDTVSLHNIFINIRNTGKYQMSNLFLFIKTTSPLGFSKKDTLECILADDKGNWLGKGFGSIWNNHVLYKQYVKFPVTGTYTFEIEQAMRIETLPGIVDIGLRIEKVDIK